MTNNGSCRAPGSTILPLPNEIIGLIADELRDDTPALRACSTASILLYHFCKRHLYRSVNLDTPDKVDGFILTAEDTDLHVLRHTHALSLGIPGVASWRYADKLVAVLGIFSKKASLKRLSLKELKFTLVSRSNVTDLIETVGDLSRTVSELDLFDCLFVRREDIESLFRSFPSCKSLRLRRCAWQSAQLPPMFPSPPTHTVSLDELEITTRKTLSAYDLSGIVERDWLDTTGLKALTYTVIEHAMATKMFNAVQDCHLENLRISCRCKESYPFVFRKMKRVIPRVRSLTIASDGPGALWSLSFLLRTFRTLHNIEHLTVATTDHISENSQFWNAIDAICGSTRTYGLLETVEFCFSSVRPASGAEYMRIEELGEKLPYLVEHGMLKVSDPKAGMDWIQS